MRVNKQYCLDCGLITEHTPFSEEEIYPLEGKDIQYTVSGIICNVCGLETQTKRQMEASRRDIGATFLAMQHKT